MADWFHAKSHGYGAGLPCSWQGWVVTIAFIALATIAGIGFGESQPYAFLGIMLILVPAFMLIAKATTKGGWKWRSGEKDD